MKKLLFATALVASAAAFADGEPTALNAISFEGYTAGATFANGAAEQAEAGGDKGAGPYFYYDGDGDGSSVKAFGGENAAAPSITRPYYFASATPNANYLDLSTEGGILWRSINAISAQGEGVTTYGLGQEQAIAADGTYLDTLVQFTPTEDGGAPTLENEDKLAIWLNVDSTTGETNLMVQAGYVDDEGTLVPGGTNLVLSGVSVNPGQWYRLTVKAYENILTENDELKYPAFSIFIDSTELSASVPTISPVFAAGLSELFLSGMASKVSSGAVLVSRVAGDPAETSTLAGVGFKGSGALDDIVWTTEDPFANAPQPSADYQVTINGSDVPVTPSAEDLAAVQAAVIAGGGTLDVTDVAAVNAALAAPIGSTSIPSWQALFLGLPPTEAGLESFKINSISFNEDGDIVVTLPAAVDPKTGRGVDITLKLKEADTPNAASWSDVESATGTTFAPFAPGSTDTKKFYKVVVEFAATPAQN